MENEVNAGQEIDDVLNLNIDDLFKDEENSQAQETSEQVETDKTENDKNENVDMTKNMTNRINEVRRKTERETQEKIAKQQGYESYADMLKAQEQNLVKDHGYDPADIEDLLEKMVEKRLANDPRFKKLEEFEEIEKSKYIESQIARINKSANTKITKIEDLPKETIDLWSKGVELETAYLATVGKDILMNKIAEANKGTLNHLAPLNGVNVAKTRGLTEEEKNMYRRIIPGITDEELAKKTQPINK